MFRLSRIRATSVGPDGARFDRPSPGAAPFDLALMSSGTPCDSVVWLENGGGKTVLLTLLFHVLRPDRAVRVGDEAGRRGGLGDFLRNDDVGHVQLEWLACDAVGIPTGERLITGMVAERRTRLSGDEKVEPTWYALLVRDGSVTLDDLRTEENGRRIPKRAFVEALRERAQEAGSRRGLDLRVSEGVKGKWIEALTELGLDPALLEYQIEMNRAEGGAAKLFRFSSDEKFLEFLLGLVTDPAAIAAARETIDRVAGKLASLPGKQREVAFADGALIHLEPLVAEHARARRAEAELLVLRGEARALASRLVAAVRAEDSLGAEQTERFERARVRALDADRARRTIDGEVRQLRIDVAEFVLQAAEHDLTMTASMERQLDIEWRAWEQVPARLELDRRGARVRALSDEFEQAEAQSQPLREARDRAGAELRRRIAADAFLLRVEAMEAGHKEDTATATAQGHRARQQAAMSRCAVLRHESENLQKQLDEHARKCSDVQRRGYLRDQEDPATAAARVEAAIERDAARLTNLEEELASLSAERSAVWERYQTALPRAAAEESRARELSARAEAGARERRRLVDDTRLAELAGLASDELDLDLLGVALIDRLALAARGADARRIDAEVRRAADRRALHSLDGDTGLLPARSEVESALELLREAGVTGATAGWRHVADAIGRPLRMRVLAARPDLVDGIVLPDGKLEEAERALSAARLCPAAAVVVGTVEELQQGERDEPVSRRRFVVEPTAALFDREAAVDELTRIRQRRDGLDAIRSQLEAQAQRDRALALDLQRHIERWPLGALRAAVESAKAAAEVARTWVLECESLRGILAEIEQREDALKSERGGLSKRIDALRGEARVLAPLAEEAKRVARYPEQISEARHVADGLEAQATHAGESATESDLEARRWSKRSAELEQNARRAVQEAGMIPAPAHPDEGRLLAAAGEPAREVVELAHAATSQAADSLRERFSVLDDRLRAATSESQLARDLAAAREGYATSSASWRALEPVIADRATGLSTTPHATDPVALELAKRSAMHELEQARHAKTVATSARDDAKRQRSALPPPRL